MLSKTPWRMIPGNEDNPSPMYFRLHPHIIHGGPVIYTNFKSDLGSKGFWDQGQAHAPVLQGTPAYRQAIDDWAAAHPEFDCSALYQKQDRLEANARLREIAETTGKPGFVRWGRAPKGGRSYNHRDGHYESGVSVYPAYITPTTVYVDLRDVDGVSSMFIRDDRPVYRIFGEVIGEGADGEPLINVTRSRKLSQDIEIIY